MPNELQEVIVVSERDSAIADKSGLIITAIETFTHKVKLVVGRPGLPNLTQTLGPGGAVLFETPSGLFEVRILKTASTKATVLISRVAPRPGIAAGFVNQEQDNVPFSADEQVRISDSVKLIYLTIADRSDIAPEQLAFIERKLDEMQAASERMGRKDWINLALGTLTGAVVAAALEPKAARALFEAADSALSWLFAGGMKLLS